MCLNVGILDLRTVTDLGVERRLTHSRATQTTKNEGFGVNYSHSRLMEVLYLSDFATRALESLLRKVHAVEPVLETIGGWSVSPPLKRTVTGLRALATKVGNRNRKLGCKKETSLD